MAEKLAIFKDLPEIISKIKKNTVTWVIVETGSGKSIGVPYALIRDGGRVMCTQPTIPAATSLFGYQKKLSPQFNIGFAAEGTVQYTKASHAVYCTAGHMRKVMKGYFKNGKASDMLFTNIILLDEVHTGSKDNSIIIDLWVEAYRQGVKVPKLVLATATEFGCHDLMQRLAELVFPAAVKAGVATEKDGPRPVIFRSTFRHHKVEVRYQRKNYEEPDSQEAFADAAKIAVDLLTEKRSHGLVFCSGASEVEDVAFEIDELIKSRGIRNAFGRPVKVLPCYGQAKREDVDDAICDEDEKPENERIIKIVVTTNLCESSLTVPGVIFIVDMLSEKRSDLVGGRFHLGTTWISKNSADQRKGRTGRTLSGGVCHRMCSEEIYARFEDFRPLEITRTPITDIVIECMTCGLDPVKVISDLELSKLIEAKNTLIETGCISTPEVKKTEQQLYDEKFPSLGKPKVVVVPTPEVTKCGFFVSDMPMDVRNAAAMYKYLTESNSTSNFWAMVYFIVVDLYGPPLFFFPRKEKHENPKHYRARLEEHSRKYFSKFQGNNPVESLVFAMYDCLHIAGAEKGLDAPFGKLRMWAVDNSCNNKKLREIIIQIKRVQKILNYSGYESVEYDPKIDKLAISKISETIIRCFSDMYKSKVLIGMGGKYLSSDHRQLSVDTMKTVSRVSPGYKILPLSEICIRTPDREILMVSLWMPYFEIRDETGVSTWDDSDSW